MIERFYLKSCLTFDEVALEFDPGLIVFTGPSGSGKSVLMRSILASVGFADALAEVSESSLNWQLDEDETGIENEEVNVFRQVKREKVRYFINNQSVSKRVLQDISRKHLRHLSLKDFSDFEQESLLELIDGFVAKSENEHLATIAEYDGVYSDYRKVVSELKTLEEEENRILDLKEFAAFELAKIDAVAPKAGEYDELMVIKKSLSKKEKAEEKITTAEAIFEFEHVVSEALNSLELDSGFFDDTMNELRVKFDDARQTFAEVEETDIESVLDRIEQLSELKRRYGSIEEALAYRDEKAKEVQKYENFEEEKSRLVKARDELYERIMELVKTISLSRSGAMYDVNEAINGYLKQLYLEGAGLSLSHGDFGLHGQDFVEFDLKGASLDKVSAGEFNRLRLALLAVKAETMKGESGVLMLDEIDANLSGEESMSVAKVLRKLSKYYQIFVISHQPQLTSMGEQHFLVTKDEYSTAVALSREARIDEIARMISGDTVTPEAKQFAKELLDNAPCASS
ncbi:MAG: ATPase [Sulfurimonadaceae bacterium]|nr:ATPase [Sulfurimonadaceae bacterium]